MFGVPQVTRHVGESRSWCAPGARAHPHWSARLWAALASAAAVERRRMWPRTASPFVAARPRGLMPARALAPCPAPLQNEKPGCRDIPPGRATSAARRGPGRPARAPLSEFASAEPGRAGNLGRRANAPSPLRRCLRQGAAPLAASSRPSRARKRAPAPPGSPCPAGKLPLADRAGSRRPRGRAERGLPPGGFCSSAGPRAIAPVPGLTPGS